MSNIFDFGEIVEGYDVKVLNEREARAGAGILFLAGFISFINCMVMENLFVTKIFISVFLIECAQQTDTPLLSLDKGLIHVAKSVGIEVLEV